jgi:tRNA-intron endonuclease
MKRQAHAQIVQNMVVALDNDAARTISAQSSFGVIKNKGQTHFAPIEALYLVENERLVVSDYRGNELSFDQLFKRLQRSDKQLQLRYAVFSDLRTRGYTVKTALKFGSDFRVYEKGKKPGEVHAKWIVYPIHETQKLSWQEFASKNRVAHSTRKKILLAVVDDELDVSYFEVGWLRP